MPKQWYIADTHFGHASIINICQRPFDSIQEHDEALIENWNRTVGEDDVVWFLGDFVYKSSPKLARQIFDRLNGAQKHLLWGNHNTRGPDSRTSTMQLPWTSQQHYAETVDDGTRVCLFHYGMRVWPGMHKGAIHLYGHSHSKLMGTRQCIDVGVDNFGFAPVDIQTIRARLALLPALDIVEGTDAVHGLEVEPYGEFYEDGGTAGPRT